MFQTNPDLVVRDPILMWQGHHTIDVRARVQGIAETLDPTLVSLPILIDTVAPQTVGSLVAAGTDRFAGGARRFGPG